MQELTATAPDGYPVHGWLVHPDPDRYAGPRPVLLVIHGGPHAQYGYTLFDEAQVYAGAGYVVVMGNPRGAAGYGEDHGRAISHRHRHRRRRRPAGAARRGAGHRPGTDRPGSA